MSTRESAVARDSPLDQLKTIQLLEESVGPKSLRQLRNVLPDEPRRRVIEEVSRDAGDALRELDDVVHEWTRQTRPGPEAAPPPVTALGHEEILLSVIELKDSEAQMLKRAADTAPTEALADRLRTLGRSAEDAADRLRTLL